MTNGAPAAIAAAVTAALLADAAELTSLQQLLARPGRW